MNKSLKVISDFNCIDLFVPLMEDYFYLIVQLFNAQNRVTPAAKAICIFFQRLRNTNIHKKIIVLENKSFFSENWKALNSEKGQRSLKKL